MTNKRRIYLRRKEKSHWILEGKTNGKTTFLWTIPNLEIFVKEILLKSSFITQEKKDKISQKFNRLDFKSL